MGDENNKDDENIADQSGKDTAGAETKAENAHSDSVKSEKQEKTFTQRQVSAMMTSEKKQGRAAAYREMGIEPEDTKTVAMVKAFIEAQKSDEEKAREQSTIQAAELAKAEQRAIMAETKAELMVAGCNPNYIEDASTLLLSKLSKQEGADVKTLAEELKSKYPVWFNGDSQDDNKPGLKGTGSSVNSSSNNGKDTIKGIGQRLAAQRKSGQTKSSFWK